MDILHTKNKERFVAYHRQLSNKNKAPCIVFLHGLMSNMKGDKALHLEKYCLMKGYSFIRFDNFGHGHSSGEFVDQNISLWLEGLNLVLEELTEGPVLLVGSSMGGWVALLAMLQRAGRIIGMVGIAAAPDFSEELMWNKLSNSEQSQFIKDKIYEIKGENAECNYVYPISYDFILNGRDNLLLNKDEINISRPVHLIHGMKDIDVPFSIALRLAEKIKSEEVTLKLIKGANHKLSRPQDLLTITNSIEEILASIY